MKKDTTKIVKLIKRMTGASTYIFLALFLTLSLSCSHSRREENSLSQPTTAQSNSQRPRGKGYARVMGRGQQGARQRRVWSAADAFRLSREEQDVIGIETAAVSRKALENNFEAMGKVLANPYDKAIVSYAFPARVAERHVRIGDWVKKGQSLVTLQSEEVGIAKSEFYMAKADCDLARINHERAQRLFDRGVGAKKDFLSSDAELKVAEATLTAAEKKLHVLGFNEDQVTAIAQTHQINPVITLFAPISGKVIIDNAVIGSMIDQGTEILTILDPRMVCIDAEIYEQDIAKVRLNQEIALHVPAYPGELFKGKVCFISDILNSETRTITVRSEIPNRDLKLKPGMFADIKILIDHQPEVLVVPAEAVLEDNGNKIVFSAEDGTFTPKIIQTGIKHNGNLEILAGLKEGERVVTRGNFQLKSKLYDDILKKAHVH
jgi:cobalt-zinc-cadmium efflux system membrane fusion protein